MCVVSWLSMLGSLSTVLALVLGALISECCLGVFSTEREHCRKFLLRRCGRLLRQAGGFKRSGMKALCAFLWALGHEAAGPKHVLFFSMAPSPSSSESEMTDLVRRMVGLRLWERCLGLGSQKSEHWRLARRLCCGLLNIIQYGGQDGSSPDEEEGWGRCWLVKPLCSPVSTQFSRLNVYCHMNKPHVSSMQTTT